MRSRKDSRGMGSHQDTRENQDTYCIPTPARRSLAQSSKHDERNTEKKIRLEGHATD